MPSPPLVDPSALKREAAGRDPPPRPCPTLCRMLRLAGAQPHHRICVAGPSGLAAMLSLCHLGFFQACCLGRDAGCCGEAPCDLLLVTGPLERESFVQTLSAALPRLRAGGVLAVHETCLDDDAEVSAILADAGRQPGWRVHDLAGSCLVAMQVLACERGVQPRRAAA